MLLMIRPRIFKLVKLPKYDNSTKYSVQTLSRIDVLMNHAYYRKTLTKNELLTHLKDNVVYNSDEYIASNVPAGLPFKIDKTWLDTVSPLAAEVGFNDILEDLPEVFNTETAWLTKYPRRNASGIAIFSKSHESRKKLSNGLTLGEVKGDYVHTFLVVVLGRPPDNYTQLFGLKSVLVNGKYGTEVLLKFNPKKNQKVQYRHEVIASSDLVSLVKVDVSNDNRDCVRHILASTCLTPILGDHYNYKRKKNSIMGVPLVMNPSVLGDDSVELEPELLTKLDLQSGEEKFIPIHSHLYSVKTVLKNNRMLVVSGPPPDCFVWTCNQFGLSKINEFLMTEKS